MTQKAVVKQILSQDIARVSLMRQLECGLNCKSCEGCPQMPRDEVFALAENKVGAAVGDVVEVDFNSGSAIGIAALVYLVPITGMILFYLIGQVVGFGEGGSVLCAFVGVLAGFVPAALFNRAITKKNKPEFTILSIEG